MTFRIRRVNKIQTISVVIAVSPHETFDGF